MTAVTSTISKSANHGGVDRFTKKGRALHLVARIMEAAQRAWPTKPRAVVADETGVSERAVKYWLAGNTTMDLVHAAELLDTEEGFEILAAIMGTSKVRWWRIAQLAQERDTVAKQIRAAEVKLERVKASRAQIELDL